MKFTSEIRVDDIFCQPKTDELSNLTCGIWRIQKVAPVKMNAFFSTH